MKTTLRNLILGLIVFVVLLILVNNMVRGLWSADVSCSALISAATNVKDDESKKEFFTEKMIDKCQPDFVQIGLDHVSINGIIERVPTKNGIKPSFEPDELEDIVYYIFANELTKCWKLALEGKAELSEKFKKGIICSKISLTNPAQELILNNKMIFPSFFNYLKTHKIPEKEITYQQYFLENDFSDLPIIVGFYTEKGIIKEALLNSDFKINLPNTYYILFISDPSDKNASVSKLYLLGLSNFSDLLLGTIEDKPIYRILN